MNQNFSLILLSEKLFFPIEIPILPSLSFLISICPDFKALTADSILFVTVPSFWIRH